MSAHYADIAFTDQVGDVQERYGSREFYARRRNRASGPDRITSDVRTFLATGLIAELSIPGCPAVIERGVIVTVEAFDWNCQQHITPRYTVDDLEPHLDVLRHRITELEAENSALRDDCRPSEGT